MHLWDREELWRWSILLFIGTVIVYTARSALPVVSVLVQDDFGWDHNVLGKVMGSFSYGYMMSQIAGGFLADRFGGGLVLAYCGVIWSALTLLTPTIVRLSNSPAGAMIIIRMMLGVSQGLHYPSFTSLIGEKVREGERSFPYSFIASGGQVGLLLVGSIGSWIARSYKWDYLFTAIGLSGFIWSFYVYKINREYSRGGLKRSRSLENPNPARPNLCKKAVFAMMFAHLVSNNTFFILFNWLPAYFHTHWPEAPASVYASAPWSLSLFGCLGSGYLSDMLGKKYNMTFARKFSCSICLGLSAVFLYFLSKTSAFYAAIFNACMACTASAFGSGSILINPSDLYPEASGFLFGIMNTVGAIPGFLGVQTVGYALHHGYEWPQILRTIGGLNILGNIVYILFGSAKRLV